MIARYIALALMVISLCAACSGGAPAVPPQASVPPSTSPPAAASTPVSAPSPTLTSSPVSTDPQQLEQQFSGLGYAVTCGGIASAGAAPYAGPAPHPVDFEGDNNFSATPRDYQDADLDGGDMDVFELNGVLNSSSANASIESASWIPASAARVQLVACVTMDTSTTTVGSCQYTGKRATLDAAQYTLTLYVARTGRKLAGPVTLQGSDKTCPGLAISYGSSLTVYASLGLNQVEAIIGKYV